MLSPEDKRAVEGYLRRHHRFFTACLILLGLAIFILPWLYVSFLTALVLQIFGAALLYGLGKLFTTAFDSDGGDPIFRAPRPEEDRESDEKK
ncbi:MAG: hypothetical protein C4530_20865 [Desulfobacteraceae bacterium]|nr:MAG: hypothetical protein C4530_20865 [Desulfobacteraceae bacterium]